MIEAVLIALVALVVLYYLYGALMEYLSNENNQKRFERKEQAKIGQNFEPSLEEKVARSEFGVLSGILGYVAYADGEICRLESEVAQSLLREMAREMSKLGSEQEIGDILLEIFKDPKQEIENLAKDFSEFSKGDYKKKLKVVEFCFVLGYADGSLNEKTREAIIDVAALLELDNADFNRLYEDFTRSNNFEVSLEEAREIFGAASPQELEQRYSQLIDEDREGLRDEERGESRLYGREDLDRLKKIHLAYELLKKERKEEDGGVK